MTDKPKMLTLREAADVLGMKRPNVRDFLSRRGIEPAMETGYGPLWAEADVLRAKNDRAADEARLSADAQRRRSALRRRNGAAALRLGARQKDLLSHMELVGPWRARSDAERLALRRLNDRGLVARTDDGWILTDAGREVVNVL